MTSSEPKKILILRFSSIGDIVLTSPVIRAIKAQRPDWEVHYFTKPAYRDLLIHHPQLDQVHLLESPLRPQLARLQAEKFDFILDLHHNVRTWRIKRSLGVASAAFPKENWRKYWMVRRKQANILPHIVQRYGQTLAPLGLSLDEKGLDFFLPPGKEDWAKEELPQHFDSLPANLLAVALGAQYRTKRWLPEHFVSLLNRLQRPVLLLGGPDALEEAQSIAPKLTVPFLDGVGTYDLLSAAALMKACAAVLTHDTGFMHIAAAFQMPIYSLWGSTVPAFGMTPYQTPHLLLENKGLDCRPCSKIGYDQCPKGHFRCMKDLTPEQVEAEIRAFEQTN